MQAPMPQGRHRACPTNSEAERAGDIVRRHALAHPEHMPVIRRSQTRTERAKLARRVAARARFQLMATPPAAAAAGVPA